MTTEANLQIEIKRRVAASPERLFRAWTTPEHLLAWWGPKGVRCTEAEVDLTIGGSYRFGNELPDGQVVYIVGEFLEVEAPNRLVYTWSTEGESLAPERVTVSFIAYGDETEVVILHEKIHEEARREQHTGGWHGCLDGLVEYMTAQG
jgi:uncharacterized protein YndB with AHSA1/START domain